MTEQTTVFIATAMRNSHFACECLPRGPHWPEADLGCGLVSGHIRPTQCAGMKIKFILIHMPFLNRNHCFVYSTLIKMLSVLILYSALTRSWFQLMKPGTFAALTCKVETQGAVMYCILVVLQGTKLVNLIQCSVIFKYGTNNSEAHS
jgi:hypothetical protein